MTALGKKLLAGGIVVIVAIVAIIIRNVIVYYVVRGAEKALEPGEDGSTQSAPVGWTVDSCLRITSQPTLPTSITMLPGQRQAKIQALTTYAPVDCSDAQAFTKIVSFATKNPADPAGALCPEDSDGSFQADDNSSRIVCTRNLRPPHPGDPGGGGGGIVVGDCVSIGSSESDSVTNDEVSEQACDPGGWFAQVAARVDDATTCPAATVSRIPLQDGRKGSVLCLVPGDHGVLAKPGDCVNLPANTYYSAYKVDCAQRLSFRLLTFAATAQQCPAEAELRLRESGYDAVLCLASTS